MSEETSVKKDINFPHVEGFLNLLLINDKRKQLKGLQGKIIKATLNPTVYTQSKGGGGF